MRRRTLTNGTIVTAGLLAVTAAGVAIANAATSPGSSTALSQCEKVFLASAPAGDPAGSLCTTVDGSAMTVTFTPASACDDRVMLRVSGADASGVEFGDVQTVACSPDRAMAAFTPGVEAAADSFVCGLLLAEKYTAAQACVPIS
ncbi:hypothetical protein [Actinoplanes sp. HUAS TT8]|uniref:hypothetical protein n=1 Tax=Actinoplanes sp. HUAS TT8 TaxID=3447453 RepID=UPI003F51BFA0